jgi:hypothetical protein
MAELPWKIRAKDRMRASTVEGGPVICLVGNMKMKKGNRCNPTDDPAANEQPHGSRHLDHTHEVHISRTRLSQNGMLSCREDWSVFVFGRILTLL